MSLATTLIENGQFKLAESLIRSSLAKAPSDPELLLSAADLLRAQGDIEGCKNALRRVVAKQGDDTALAKAAKLLAILDQQAERGFAPVPFAHIDNVLPPETLDGLLSFVLANEDRFQTSKVKAVGQVDANLRRSRVWQGVDDLPAMLRERVGQAVAGNAKRLGVQAPLNEAFETEISAYQDGDFVLPHWDRGDRTTNNRRITTLFYFYALPARFSGGHLQLFDTGPDGAYDRAGFTSFAPTYNTMLQFRSEAVHAVPPVRGPTCFADSRFCLTFWALAPK